MQRLLAAFVLSSAATLALAATPGAALHALFDAEWQRGLKDDPVGASYLGDQRYNDRWGNASIASILAQRKADAAALARLRTIKRAGLSQADQLNYDLFERTYKDRVAAAPYPDYLIPFDNSSGIHTLSEMAISLPFNSAADYRNWIARMETLDVLMDQTITLMRTGVKEGWVAPKIVLRRTLDQIRAQVVELPEQSPWYAPFASMPAAIPAAEQQQLRERARKAIATVVVPQYRRYEQFFAQDYLPHTRDSVGASAMPNGSAYYAAAARKFTTTSMTPDQIHALGQSEVKRIRAEMEKIIAAQGFKGSFDAFLVFLRTDPQFQIRDPKALLEAYQALAKRIDPELPKLFRKMPRMPYGVRPIPDTSAPTSTTAYYNQPAADGSRAGYYFVNLYQPETRPTYEMEALSLHESVPGHHFQIALAMELGELPAFRRYGSYTAYVEGWGLYAESLGEELGMYKDPYSKFGQLTYEMWRAVRLVVDTGMHAKGWTRDQAIAFFKANAAKSENDIVNEIDRYIAWPGQALGYKIGELKIKELRARATTALGPRFDLRSFHDVVLGSGAIPLDVLERQVDAWIASEMKKAK